VLDAIGNFFRTQSCVFQPEQAAPGGRGGGWQSLSQKNSRVAGDANFLLTTILWGNVGINVLLTLLSNSVMTGVMAFAFSTIVITFAGEIFPQAYFSRRAMKMAVMLGPVLHFYQYVLYPVAKPGAWMLDKWLGAENTEYLKERQLRGVIEQHIESDRAEIDLIEGLGALNFLEIDDIPIEDEGATIDPASIIALPTTVDMPVLPTERSVDDAFARNVDASGKMWVILTDQAGKPQLILDADSYLRAVLIDVDSLQGYEHCHRPIVVTDPAGPLGHIIASLKRDWMCKATRSSTRTSFCCGHRKTGASLPGPICWAGYCEVLRQSVSAAQLTWLLGSRVSVRNSIPIRSHA